MQLIDLTISLPADHPMFLKAMQNADTPFAGGHIGTHLDTPLHTSIPLEYFEREAVLIDARAHGADIVLDAIEGVDIRPGDFVVFYTAQVERHPYGSDPYYASGPQLDWTLIEELVRRKVSFIGVDAAGIRREGKDHGRADHFCEENGTYVIENITNLGALTAHAGRRFRLHLGWIAHQEMTGVPVKVVAEVE